MINEIDVKKFLLDKYVIITIKDKKLFYWDIDCTGYVNNIFLAGLYSQDQIDYLLKNRQINKVIKYLNKEDLYNNQHVAVEYFNLINNASKILNAYITSN